MICLNDGEDFIALADLPSPFPHICWGSEVMGFGGLGGIVTDSRCREGGESVMLIRIFAHKL